MNLLKRSFNFVIAVSMVLGASVSVSAVDYTRNDFANGARWNKLVDDSFDTYEDGTKLDGIEAAEGSGATYGSKNVSLTFGGEPSSNIEIATDSERGKVLSVGASSSTAAGLTFGEAVTTGVVAVSMDVKILSSGNSNLRITVREGAPSGMSLNGTSSNYRNKISDGKNPDMGDVAAEVVLDKNGIRDSKNNVTYSNTIKANNWMNIKFIYDIDAETYDIYADGVQVNEEPIAFANDWKNNSNSIQHKYKFFSSLYFTSNNASNWVNLLIDNLQIYKENEVYTKAVEEVVPGENISVKLMEDESLNGATVYVAAYDSDGRLLGAEGETVSSSYEITTNVSSEGANQIKVFVWDADQAPLAYFYTVDLS